VKTLRREFHKTFPLGSVFSRNLLILSILVVILLPAYNAAFVYPSLTKLFTENIMKDATSIAKHFMSMFEARTSELTKNSLDFQALKEINTLREDFGLSKLKIFSRSGEILFSTDSKEIGDINTERYFREIVAQGNVYSTIVKKNSDSLEHQRMLVDVVETYVPMVKDGVFLGAFEIYYDITEKKQSLERLLLSSFVIVIVLALSLLIMSVMNVVKEKGRLIERKRAEDEREKLIGELQDAIAKARTLRGLLPICSSCKKIRDDKGYWNQLEAYILEHSEAEFTHGICPDCMKNLYGVFLDDDPASKKR
jgi:two-component system, cell cycle sensor histidine kinase and response regulator CckA